MISMEKDIRRMLQFFERQAFMVVMERESGNAKPALAAVLDHNSKHSLGT
ncbi:MAG: hypothetical protein ACI9WC_003098 [Arenicella sp.]